MISALLNFNLLHSHWKNFRRLFRTGYLSFRWVKPIDPCLFVVGSRVADPHSFHPDPDPASSIVGWIPIRIQGFNDQKLKINYSWKKTLILFGSKTTIYLSLGLHKERPSYRRSLQLSKEAIHLKTWNFLIFFILLWVIFALLDPDLRTRLNPEPQPWLVVRHWFGTSVFSEWEVWDMPIAGAWWWTVCLTWGWRIPPRY